MSTKNEYTIEELEAQYRLAEEHMSDLGLKIEEKKREERELKNSQLAKEKNARKNEIDEAFNKYKTPIKSYIDDYGVYSYTTTTDDSFVDLFSSKFWNYIL